MEQKICQFEQEKYQSGDWVWVLRNPNPGKMESWWVGPTKIVKRIGDQSYQVSLEKEHSKEIWDVHWDFLKPYKSDWVSNTDVPLYFHKGTTHSTLIDGDYDMIEEICAHKFQDENLVFLVKWKNTNQKNWVKVNDLIHGCSKVLLSYAKEVGLKDQILENLS